MKKKSVMKEVKFQNTLSVVVGVSIMFSALTAILGYEALSIGNAMVLVVFCVLCGMTKDLKDLCNELVEDEWYGGYLGAQLANICKLNCCNNIFANL